MQLPNLLGRPVMRADGMVAGQAAAGACDSRALRSLAARQVDDLMIGDEANEARSESEESEVPTCFNPLKTICSKLSLIIYIQVVL